MIVSEGLTSRFFVVLNLRRILLFALFSSLPFICTSVARADAAPIQFVKVGNNAYLEVSQEQCSLQMVITPAGDKNDPAGIFGVVSSRNVPLQFFDPKTLKPESTLLSFFLEVKEGKFIAIFLDKAKRWPIGGSFSLNLPCNIRINHDGSNSYLSITKQNDTHAAILGVFGSTPMINSTDNATIFEATSRSDLLAPYAVNAEGISLQGQALPNDAAVGLQLEENKSVCLSPSAVFLEKSAYQSLSREKNPKIRIQLLKKILSTSKTAADPRANLVIIKGTDPVVGYHPESDSYVLLKAISIKGKVCGEEPLELNF